MTYLVSHVLCLVLCFVSRDLSRVLSPISSLVLCFVSRVSFFFFFVACFVFFRVVSPISCLVRLVFLVSCLVSQVVTKILV